MNNDLQLESESVGCVAPTVYRAREVRCVTVQEGPSTIGIAGRPVDSIAFYQDVVRRSANYDCEVEHFVVLHLNRKNRIKAWSMISTGTATAALAHPREVFRAAIMESACAIVCLHNHPSGDPAPSAGDLNITRMLREAAKTVDIELVDHVIVGEAACDPVGRGYFSFREAGML